MTGTINQTNLIIVIHFLNSVVYFHDISASWITAKAKKQQHSLSGSGNKKTHREMNKTYLINFCKTLVMIFAEKAILLLGSLKVRALCAMYLASQTNAEKRLRKARG